MKNLTSQLFIIYLPQRHGEIYKIVQIHPNIIYLRNSDWSLLKKVDT